jgi:hypothetical protein
MDKISVSIQPGLGRRVAALTGPERIVAPQKNYRSLARAKLITTN